MNADLAAEAVRLHRRYLVEIVEELGFCPWARKSRVSGRIRHHASLTTDEREAARETEEAIGRWTAEADVEVGFVIFPRLEITRRAFDTLTSQVNQREAERHAIGEVPFVMAAFHPEASVDTATGERLIPFLRRTPDPSLQLVRVSVLEAVRANTPQGTRLVDMEEIMKGMIGLDSLREELPLRERIARQNLQTARELGLQELARRLDDIRADRDRTYAALAHP
jgi:hypothetical protein